MNNNFVDADNFDYAPYRFYISQIERLIQISDQNPKVQAWAPAIVSFFSGQLISSNDEEQPQTSAVHLRALFYAKDSQKLIEYFESNHIKIAVWVERLFYYFRIVDAYPLIAKELITICCICEILDFLENKKVKSNQEKILFLRSYIQILPYADRINEEKAKDLCLKKINYDFDVSKINLDSKILLLTTRIVKANRGNKTYYEAINKLKDLIIKISLFDNISILNSIYLEDREFFLKHINLVKKRIMEAVSINQFGNSFDSLIINLFDDKMFSIIRDIYASINFKNLITTDIKNHMFTIVNSNNFLAGNENLNFDFANQYSRYRDLISSQNIYLNSYTSLAFDTAKYNSKMDYSRYHIATDSLDSFIEKNIDCYRIKDIDYTTLESVTFLPIDTHPIQGCIVI